MNNQDPNTNFQQIVPDHIHMFINIVGAIHESPGNNNNRAHHDAPLRGNVNSPKYSNAIYHKN